MIVSIGADHGGVLYKDKIKEYFKNKVKFIDVGSYEINKYDNYAEIALKVGENVQNSSADLGIMICRTGVGAVVALNKMKGIRAGVCESILSVELARSKNNINVLSFGADNISIKKSIKIIEKFLTVAYEGGRHEARLKVIRDYEEKHTK